MTDYDEALLEELESCLTFMLGLTFDKRLPPDIHDSLMVRTGQANKRIEQFVEKGEITTDQIKPAGEMVLVPLRALHSFQQLFESKGLWGSSHDMLKMIDAAVSVEQTPAVCGEPLIHINPAVLAALRGQTLSRPGGLTYSLSSPVGGWTVPLYEKQEFGSLLTEMQTVKFNLEKTDKLYEAAVARVAVLEAQQGEPITVEAVAVTRLDEEGSLCLDWLVEGGISALEIPGQVLVVAHGVITDKEGSGEVYLHAADRSPEPDQRTQDE